MIIGKPEEKEIFNQLVELSLDVILGLPNVSVDSISGIKPESHTILSLQNYPFLYIEDRQIPIIYGDAFQIQEIIPEPEVFLKYCYNEQAHLFTNDTLGEIDIKFNNIER